MIVLDPGHGIPDPGAVGTVNESDICLQICLLVEKHLERHNVPVELTRYTRERIKSNSGQDLAYRTNLAQDLGATHFLSVHMNAFGDKLVRGTEIFTNYNDSNFFALNVLDQVVSDHNFVNRGLKHRAFRVLGNPTFQSALLEVEFISNPVAERYVLNNLEGIAISISKGILKSIGVEWREKELTWKEKIIKEAHELGLIKDLNRWLKSVDEPMPTWAVLQVAINVLKRR